MNIANLRQNYTQNELLEENVASDPIIQFQRWFEDALNAQIPEPNAMILSTVNGSGGVSSRVLLLKDVSDIGFTFFTNYASKKGAEIEQNPHVAMTFLWLQIERQVRIEGVLTKVPEADSVEYFNSRPRGSQLGAWASSQSQIIENREELEKRLAKITQKFEGQDIPKPDHWGGYILSPDKIEFWQGRPNRLHDRLEYFLMNGEWHINRLMP